MYREYEAVRSMRERVQCLWQHRLTLPGADHPVLIVPDGCVDLLWDGRELRVAGPDTRPVIEQVSASSTIHGLRFVTGSAHSVLGIPLSAVRNQRVALTELWGERAQRCTDVLAALPSRETLAGLSQLIWNQRASWTAVDTLVMRLVARLRSRSRDPELRLSALARELGVSERQLLRRCVSAVGYGPKLLARILRIQQVVASLKDEPEGSLAELAARLGFADQAHLSHDAMELLGRSPGALQKQARQRTMSDLDKTRVCAMGQAAAHDKHL